MQAESLRDLVLSVLDDMKAVDVHVVDVRGVSSVTDIILIASGNSDRHVRAIAGEVARKTKQAGVQPLGIEGEDTCEWVLVDLGDVVLHVMLPRVRDFYQLEKLWSDELHGTP
jgi:ribosome-associated protein